MAEFKRHSRFLTELDPAVVDRVKQFVLASRNIVITCHVSPDGDALGSSCALWFILKALGKNATVVTADCAPRSLQFLPGVREIVAATRNSDRVHDLIADADLIFCLDFNDITRVDRLSDAISKSPAKKVVIDHHLDPRIEGEIVISRPEISSTSALLYIFMWQAGWTRHLTRNSAACIYTLSLIHI